MLLSSQKSQSDDVVGNAEAVDDLVEECDSLFRRCRDQGHVLYPLGEFVDQHKDACKFSKGRFERPDHIQSLACEGLRGWYSLNLVCWYVDSFGEELTTFTIVD
jgi:hypothetical protein